MGYIACDVAPFRKQREILWHNIIKKILTYFNILSLSPPLLSLSPPLSFSLLLLPSISHLLYARKKVVVVLNCKSIRETSGLAGAFRHFRSRAEICLDLPEVSPPGPHEIRRTFPDVVLARALVLKDSCRRIPAALISAPTYIPSKSSKASRLPTRARISVATSPILAPVAR